MKKALFIIAALVISFGAINTVVASNNANEVSTDVSSSEWDYQGTVTAFSYPLSGHGVVVSVNNVKIYEDGYGNMRAKLPSTDAMYKVTYSDKDKYDYMFRTSKKLYYFNL